MIDEWVYVKPYHWWHRFTRPCGAFTKSFKNAEKALTEEAMIGILGRAVLNGKEGWSGYMNVANDTLIIDGVFQLNSEQAEWLRERWKIRPL